jgi:hypothetical protein
MAMGQGGATASIFNSSGSTAQDALYAQHHVRDRHGEHLSTPKSKPSRIALPIRCDGEEAHAEDAHLEVGPARR